MRPELTHININNFMTNEEILAEQVTGILNHIAQKKSQGFTCMHLKHLQKYEVDLMKNQLEKIKKLGYKIKIEHH